MWFQPKPEPKFKYAYLFPLALVPIWALWGRWMYVTKHTFEQGVSKLERTLRDVTTSVTRLTQRVDEMESKTLLKFSEVRRDLAHVEQLVANVLQKTSMIEEDSKCAASGARILCAVVVDVIEGKTLDNKRVIQQLQSVYGTNILAS